MEREQDKQCAKCGNTGRIIEYSLSRNNLEDSVRDLLEKEVGGALARVKVEVCMRCGDVKYTPLRALNEGGE